MLAKSPTTSSGDSSGTIVDFNNRENNGNLVSTNFVPLPLQKGLFNFLSLPKGDSIRYSQITLPRRATKTIFGVNYQINRAIHKFVARPELDELRYAYASPTLKQSRTNVWDEYKKRLCHIPGYKPNEALTTIKLIFDVGGGRTRQITFYVWGLERPMDLKGGFLDGLILDEDAQNPGWIYKEVFKPSLSDPFHKGWLLRLSTVRGKNHYYDTQLGYTAEMNEGNPNYKAMLSRTSILQHITKDEQAEILKEIGQDYYDQEYECIFGVQGTDKYFIDEIFEAEEEGRIGKLNHDPHHPVWTAWDIGGASKRTDATAIWFFQVPVPGMIKLIKFSEFLSLPTKEIGAKILTENPEFNFAGQVLPWDADSHRASQTPAQDLRESHNLGEVYVLKRTSKIHRIGLAKSMFNNCFFDKNACNLGLNALREYSKKWDETIKMFIIDPKHDKHSHGADAFTHIALAQREFGFNKIKVNPDDLIARSYTP